jgi:hypothetical protein
MFRLFRKDLAATYSRGSYTTTTIGKAAFDGRVRDGNGSDHSFMATKIYTAGTPLRDPQRALEPALPKLLKNECSLKTTHRCLNHVFQFAS